MKHTALSGMSQQARTGGRAFLLFAALLLAHGTPAAEAITDSATPLPQTRVDGPDIEATATVEHNVVAGLVAFTASMRNVGNVATTATITPSVSASGAPPGPSSCSAQGGATCPWSVSVPVPHTTLMPPGASIRFSYTAGPTGGVYSINVQATAPDDVDPSNNSASASIVVEPPPPPPQSDLRSTLIAYPVTATYGMPVEYLVEIENLGPDPIESTTFWQTVFLTTPGIGYECQALTPGATCSYLATFGADLYFRMTLPVGGRVAARRWGTGTSGIHELNFSTRFSTNFVDGNPANNHAPVRTPLALFHGNFDAEATGNKHGDDAPPSVE